MSDMWGWFGGQSAQSRKDTPKNAILVLRSQLEMLQKRERHLQAQMDEQDGIARKSIASNKTAARAALKHKKQHEHALDQTLAQISMLEQQVYSVEAANIDHETLTAMDKAGQGMKQIHGKLNIDIVDQTMEDFREGYAMGEEIAITYSSPGETIDETELDDELAKMEQEQLDDKMLKMGTVPVADEVHRLPVTTNGEHESSPSLSKLEHGVNALAVKNKLPAHQEEDDEEEELRKLQAEMAR